MVSFLLNHASVAAVGPMDDATAASPPPLPKLDNTFGAWLIGTFCSTLLQGMVFHQTYRYFRLYPKDSVQLKIWVLAVLFVEVLNTGMAMHVSWHYMVANYLNPGVLMATPVWSFTWSPIPGSLAAVIVELFFARRLWLVSSKFRPFVVVAVLLNLGFFSCFTALAVLGSRNDVSDVEEYLRYSYLASVAAGMIGISDVMVTTSLIYVLHTSRSGIQQTNSMIDLLIKYAISTGLIICIFNVLNIVFSIAYPRNWIFAGISITMTKLYANAFLSALNARHSLMPSEFLLMDQNIQFGTTTLANAIGTSQASHLQFARNPMAKSSSTRPATSCGSMLDVASSTRDVIELKQMSNLRANDLEADAAGLKMPPSPMYRNIHPLG